MSAPPDRAPIPELPDFELLRQVGSGGFGSVWLARNRATGKLRAVKLIALNRSDTANPAARELASITRLEQHVQQRHDHLMEIHHVGRTDEFFYYVMEPADDVSGSSASESDDYRPATLRSLLDEGPLPIEDCARYARQLLEGLACLHASGMAHRDVKPSNCLLIGGQLKLADFGLLTPSQPLVSRLGTRTYMPPDGQMDARADVYAAGLVLYEMLSGQPAERFPHLGPRAAELKTDPTAARLNRLALHAGEPRAEDRFADARAMLAAWDAPDDRSNPSRRLLASTVGILVFVGVVTWGALHFWPTSPEQTSGHPDQVESGASASAPRVPVNFITEPLEATIWLDGRQLIAPNEKPYTTPCTVPDVPAQPARLVFRRDGADDLPAGRIDFRTTRDVTAHWDSPPKGE
ncbi:MAG: serine/threonine protein kinase [Pirellulales bacterium]|nr:serine/threonine protein kinase [Pirellulales bacterium]